MTLTGIGAAAHSLSVAELKEFLSDFDDDQIIVAQMADGSAVLNIVGTTKGIPALWLEIIDAESGDDYDC